MNIDAFEIYFICFTQLSLRLRCAVLLQFLRLCGAGARPVRAAAAGAHRARASCGGGGTGRTTRVPRRYCMWGSQFRLNSDSAHGSLPRVRDESIPVDNKSEAAPGMDVLQLLAKLLALSHLYAKGST